MGLEKLAHRLTNALRTVPSRVIDCEASVEKFEWPKEEFSVFQSLLFFSFSFSKMLLDAFSQPVALKLMPLHF